VKSYLNSLNEREKWMIIGGGFALILYVYYIFLYSPLSNQVTQKSTQLVDKMTTLQWLQKVRLQNRSSQTKQKVTNSQLLTALATHLKKDPSLKFPYQLQQTASGDVQITFDTVSFNPFIAWLEKMNARYAITVTQFNSEAARTAGMCHLMILISAASKTQT
jgi:general secretion pathway protein M